MGARNTPEQLRAYAANTRDRNRKAGLVWRGLWTHPQDWPQIRELAKRLEDARANPPDDSR